MAFLSRLPQLQRLAVAENACTRLVVSNLTQLTHLDVSGNASLGILTVGDALTNLAMIDISATALANLTFLKTLPGLRWIRAQYCGVSSFTLPAGLTNLEILDLYCSSQLAKLIASADSTNLASLNVMFTGLTDFSFLRAFPKLTRLSVGGSSFGGAGPVLTNFVILPELTALNFLDPIGLKRVIVPELLAEGTLADSVASLRRRGVSVLTYPLQPRLSATTAAWNGDFEFVLAGPPGTYGFAHRKW